MIICRCLNLRREKEKSWHVNTILLSLLSFFLSSLSIFLQFCFFFLFPLCILCYKLSEIKFHTFKYIDNSNNCVWEIEKKTSISRWCVLRVAKHFVHIGLWSHFQFLKTWFTLAKDGNAPFVFAKLTLQKTSNIIIMPQVS